ncbi:hypothetical protein CR513_25415, partial [Mucuna pruriens]
MKVRAKAIIPSGSDIKATQRPETDSILARITPVRRSRPNRPNQPKAEVMTAHLVLTNTEKSPSPPPFTELKPLPKHLKYAYLDKEQQLPIIIANNLQQEQEDKLLNILRQHKKAIGWKLSDLPGINPSICMHIILMEEEIKPIRQQQRRLNSTILDVVKKEVTKLLVAGMIYPISDSQWVSPVQVLPKKSGMTSWKSYKENPTAAFWMDSQDTCRFTLHLKINTRLPSPAHLARLRIVTCHLAYVMLRVHSSGDCMEVFMDDFTVYADSFNACLENLSKDVDFNFDQPYIEAFQELKNRLTSAPILQAPNWDLPFELMFDASNSA